MTTPASAAGSNSEDDYWKNHTCTPVCSHIRPENIERLRAEAGSEELRKQLILAFKEEHNLLPTSRYLDKLEDIFAAQNNATYAAVMKLLPINNCVCDEIGTDKCDLLWSHDNELRQNISKIFNK